MSQAQGKMVRRIHEDLGCLLWVCNFRGGNSRATGLADGGWGVSLSAGVTFFLFCRRRSYAWMEDLKGYDLKVSLDTSSTDTLADLNMCSPPLLGHKNISNVQCTLCLAQVKADLIMHDCNFTNK